MKTKFTIGFLAAILIAILSGCIREDILPENDSSLVLRIQLSDTERANGRAEEPGEDLYQENTIANLRLAFYKAGQKVWDVAATQQSEGNYYIPVPETMQAQFDGENEFNIYLVANINGFAAPATEDELKSYVVSNSIAVTAASGIPTDRFAMQGFTTKKIDMATVDGKQLGTIKLKRVAAKVRIKAPMVNVAGYELDGIVSAKFRNYRDKGTLIAETIPSGASVQVAGYLDLKESNNSVHFYSYYNSWETTTPANERPEVILMLKLKKIGGSSSKAYYYRVPIEASDMKIRSNYLYNLSVTIEVLGALNEGEAVTVHGAFDVKPWTEHSDSQTLPDTQYLEILPQVSVMNMITEEFLDYKSSSEIEIKNIKASYTFVNGSTGQETTTDYQLGTDQFPKVEVQGSKIKVTSKLPVNNVPKNISFTVSNRVGGLTKLVTITQNPTEYVVNTTGTASAWQPGGYLASGLNNRAIYHIVILAPTGDMILGFPPRESRDFYNQWGGYAYTDNVTMETAEVSKMVSPSFELASQLGATVIQPYRYYRNGHYIWSNYANSSSSSSRNALGTCAEYWEKRVVNGQTVTLDDWRLPTKAEIELVEKLQTDPNSAVKSIMTGKFYWSALPSPAVEVPSGQYVNGVSATTAHVRCVRDVKDDIRKK